MKEINDVHVLDWSNFTKNTNSQVLQNNYNLKKIQINKGILFEDLVEKLLAEMFPNEVWLRTAKSRDGKRDFIYPADKFLPEQKWAECKNYNSNVSLNVVSPTLVMGSINDVECIYFFSYSPLNDNAIEGLLRYSESSGKIIKIYDGNLLENIVCRYHTKKGISELFPKTNFEKAHLCLETIQLRVIRKLKDLNGNTISPDHLFELGEPFYLSIIIQNISSEHIKYNLNINTSKKDCLLIETYEINNELYFGEIKEHTILCQTLKAISLSYTINVSTESSEHKKGSVIKSGGKIKIIDEQYLFWTGENALVVYDNCKNHLISYEREPLIIAGESGTGKSTLLNILTQDKTIYSKYTILKVNLNLTRNYCARNLFCQALGVQENSETPFDQIEDERIALSLLIDGYAESGNMIAQTLMNLYNYIRPFLFVIDDIQKINRAYIDFFGELNAEAEKRGKPIYYVFTLNEEELSFNKLLVRLNWDLNYRNCKFKVENLIKFEKNDVISFLKLKFGLTDIDQYFDSFNRSISPLELHSFSKDLKNNHIISLVPETSSYQIVNKFRFAENVNKILYFNVFVKYTCSSLEAGDIPDYILKYLYITDEIGVEFRNKYFETINKLIFLGILKESKNAVVFYHEKIRNYIGERLKFTEEDYADIYYDINTDIVSKAICALSQINRINNASKFLNDFFQSNYNIRKVSQRYEICWLIFEHLDKLLDSGVATTALNFVHSNIESLNLEQEYETIFIFLNHIIKSAQSFNWDINFECVENMAYFIKKFFDRALSTYNNEILLENYDKLNSLLINAKHILNKRRNYWLSHYSNRLAIALDRTSDPLIAEPNFISKLYKQSEDYCKKAGYCEELLLQIVIDNFNRHYIYRHNLTINILNNSYYHLVKLNREKINRLICLDYHILLLQYLQTRLDKNKNEFRLNILSKLKEKSEEIRLESRSAFYSLKLAILEIYILIDLSRYSEANDLLSKAFDFAYKKGMRQSIYKLTYIRAHLLQFDNSLGSVTNMHTQIILAFEQFMDARTLYDLKREIFLVARLLKLIHTFAPEYISSIIKRENKDVSNLLQSLYKQIQGITSNYTDLFKMKSFYVLNGVDFPTI